jgi:hypothetical protein
MPRGPRPSPEDQAYMKQHAERVSADMSRSITQMLDAINRQMGEMFVRGEYEDLHRAVVDYEILVSLLAHGDKELSEITAHFAKGSRDVAIWRNIADHRMKQIQPDRSGKPSVMDAHEDDE